MLKSIYALLFCYVFMTLTHIYYPKWTKPLHDSTITWDVSGYYMYLPAAFIYHDLKKCEFKDEIIKKYRPTASFDQAYIHKSGNYVMKYSMGQAVMYSPFFFIAHVWAKISPKYDADGFSLPYQFMISVGSLLVAFIGLFFLRKVLLFYFKDIIVFYSLIALVVGSNYLNYTAIDGPMTHNYIFTLYAILLYLTIKFYEHPTMKRGIYIGLIIGLACLTRPTEIISIFIPLFWNLNFFNIGSIKERLYFYRSNFLKISSAGIATFIIGIMQPLYWKFVGGEWLIYSYQDQGFSWLKPHIYDGLLSFRSGWLTYTPIFLFSMFGFYLLINRKNLYGTIFLFTSFFIYITFSWDIWGYGGSFGSRAMIQSYPIIMFAFASFVEWTLTLKNYIKIPILALALFFCYVNLWWTHQAHKGQIFQSEQMTKEYYLKVFGKKKLENEDLKLLDTEEYFEGQRKDIVQYYFNDLSTFSDSTYCIVDSVFDGHKAICLDGSYRSSPLFSTEVDSDHKWYRVTLDVKLDTKEWNVYQMSYLYLRFYNLDNLLKERSVKIQRHLVDGHKMRFYLDVKAPKEYFTRIESSVVNGNSDKRFYIGNIEMEGFNEAR